MSKNRSWVVGTTLTLEVEIRIRKTGVLTDPSTCVLYILLPDEVTTVTPTVSDDGTGLRSASFSPTTSGYHKYRWVTTGSAAGAREGTFYIASSAVV